MSHIHDAPKTAECLPNRVSPDTPSLSELARTLVGLPAEVDTWLPVASMAGFYEVSDLGQVRRAMPGPRTAAGRLKVPQVDGSGYLRVVLQSPVHGKHTMLVHHIVAEAFIGPRLADMTVNHKDCDKTNNRASNLEYVSRADNIRHGFANDRYPKGEDHHTAKLTDARVMRIKSMLPTHNNCELGRMFGVSDVAIRKIRLGRTWKHIPVPA